MLEMDLGSSSSPFILFKTFYENLIRRKNNNKDHKYIVHLKTPLIKDKMTSFRYSNLFQYPLK
jgi:hypothetical protein